MTAPELTVGLKAHWPAIVKGADGRHFITNHLYAEASEAKADIGPGFVRLAQELAPCLLPQAPSRQDRQAPPQPIPSSPRPGYGTTPPAQRSWPTTSTRRTRT